MSIRYQNFPEVLLDKVAAFTLAEGGTLQSFSGTDLPRKWHSLFLKDGRIWDSSWKGGWFPESSFYNKATVLRVLKEEGFV